MVEIGCVDIITEVSILASQMVIPREGHMDVMLHVLDYLKERHNSSMLFDPKYPSINKTKFQKHEWKRFYGDIKEEIMNNCSKPLGREADLYMFIDLDHSTNETTRWSNTGYFIYMNSALVNWLP